MAANRWRRLAIFLLVALSLVEALSHFGLLYADSGGYLKNAYFFQGTGQASRFRFIRPVVSILASFVARLTDMRTAFAIVNLFFWCAATLLMFLFVEKITQKSDISFLAAGFFTVAYPLLVYGDAVLTDMAGFFFILVGAHMIVNWDILKSTYAKVAISAGIMAIGVLSRETVACVFVVAVLWALISKSSVTKLILFLAIPIGALFAWAALEGLSLWGYSLAFTAIATRTQPFSESQRALTWLYTLRVAFRPDLLVLAAIGLLTSVRQRTVVKYLAILAGISVFLLAIPIVDYRFTFALFPAILPLAAIGTLQLSAFISQHLPISDAKRATTVLGLIILSAYAIETNWIALKFLSFPWNPHAPY